MVFCSVALGFVLKCMVAIVCGNERGFEWPVQEYEIWLHRGLKRLLEKQKSECSYNIKD